MKSSQVVAARRGPPEVLTVQVRDVAAPRPHEVVIRVLAASVSMPDVQARYGRTPFPPKVPFVPGYAVIGDVVAVGSRVTDVSVGDRAGALCIIGGYAEHLTIPARKVIPVPRRLDPAEAVTLVLNYLLAYQVMHRVARLAVGDPVLVVGASGGIGTAFLQLGHLAGLRTYGLASAAKHDVVRRHGATPIDYRTQDVAAVIRNAEPGGLAAVFDGVGGAYVDSLLPLLRPGGVHVVYGNPESRAGVLALVRTVAATALRRDGRRLRVYGTTSSLRHPEPYRRDWARLFSFLEDRKIEPVIDRTFPLEEAAAANELLESGAVVGNLVLLTAAYSTPAPGDA